MTATAPAAPVYPPAPNRLVQNTALLFEGGGMRNSYTSAVVNALVEQGIVFPFVGGVSAGSSCTVNYLLGDVWRTKASFTDLVLQPKFGSWLTFLQGKGRFNAQWIYREACLPGEYLPYDFSRFLAHPAQVAIPGFDRDSGETVIWTRDDIRTLDDLMVRVQASSTLPMAMPAVPIGDRVYYDGGLGIGGGIPTHLALSAGYDRIFAVLTRPKGYRKKPPSAGTRALAALYGRYPKVKEAVLTRHDRYNAALDRLEQMAAEGRAYIFYSQNMAVENSTTDHAALVKSYDDGWAQVQAELPRIREWLGV